MNLTIPLSFLKEEPEPTPDPGQEDPAQEDEEITLTYQNYPISVTGKGLSGYELKLEALTASDSDVKLMQQEITSKEALIRLYDVKLLKDGKEVQPEEAITLNIQVGEKYNGQTLKVLHVTQDGKVETLTGKVTDGVIKVTVTSLSKFGTVVEASTVGTTATSGTGTGSSSGTSGGSGSSGSSGSKSSTGSVKTGDDTVVFPYVMALILAAGTGTVLMIRGRRRKSSDK